MGTHLPFLSLLYRLLVKPLVKPITIFLTLIAVGGFIYYGIAFLIYHALRIAYQLLGWPDLKPFY